MMISPCSQWQADYRATNSVETLHQHQAMLKQETGISGLPWDLSNLPTKQRHELTGLLVVVLVVVVVRARACVWCFYYTLCPSSAAAGGKSCSSRDISPSSLSSSMSLSLLELSSVIMCDSLSHLPTQPCPVLTRSKSCCEWRIH